MSDEVCQVKMLYENPCGRQTYKDKKKCIFHLENKSDEEAKIFEKEFWNELEMMQKNENIKELDFTGFIFPNEINLHSHLFEKPVIFIGARFNNIASFFNNQFNKRADFHNVLFNNKADFSFSLFNDKASFSFAQFNNTANFSNDQFNNEVSFFSTQFNNDAYFSSEFNNKTFFDYSKFQGVASFVNAKLPYDGEDSITFKSVKFHKPKDVRFQNINLSNVSFLNTDVTEVEFLDVNKKKKNGRLVVADETRIAKDKKATYGAVAQLYRRLRRNYETNYRFAEAGDFFIGEMEMRRLDVDIGYLFNWNENPINDNGRLIEFLTKKFNIDWVKTAKIEKIDEGKAICVTDEKSNKVKLRLNDKQTKVNLIIDDGRTYELIAKNEKGELNIYNTRFKNEKLRSVVLWIGRNFSFLGLYKHISLYGESYVRPLIWTFIVIISYPMLMHWFFDASLPQSDGFLYTYLRTSAASFFQMDSTYIGERIIGFLILGLLFIALKRKFERKKEIRKLSAATIHSLLYLLESNLMYSCTLLNCLLLSRRSSHPFRPAPQPSGKRLRTYRGH